AAELAKKVNVNKNIMDIEEIQDQVEKVLMQYEPDVAKSFILYRDKKAKIRKEIAKTLEIPVEQLDDISKKNLTINSAGVFVGRYLLHDIETGKVIETMPQLWDRVAKHIALVDVMYSDSIYEKNSNYNQREIDFDTIIKIYNSYEEEDKNTRLNEIYLTHIYRRFNELRHQIIMSFEEFFFCMFTNIDSETVKDDIRAYNLNIDDLIDAQEHLITEFEKRVSVYKDLMCSFRFLPNTPTLMNSGTKNGQLCACFTLAMKDSIYDIFTTMRDAAMIFQGAGGVGINFSDIRPFGSAVDNVPHAATGPISFQSIINYFTDIIKQGGKRKGANMGILNITHPDIEKWITMKTVPKFMENYNISVGINKLFWSYYDANADLPLVDPHGDKVIRKVPSHQLFSMIADSAWKCAEPGMIYLDNINRHNPLRPILGDISITNPCAEQAMYANNSCTLGSINLEKYVANGEFDFESFREDVFTATQFLDNVLDINNYPSEDIKKESLKIRRIGLGFMGLANALYKMRIPYNSEEGFDFIEKISNLLTLYSMQASIYLAKNRGAHYYWNKIHVEDVFEETFNGYTQTQLVNLFSEKELQIYRPLLEKHGIRNTWTTTVAPTGTISMAADTSNGIEPIYALVFVKQTGIGNFYYTNKEFESALKDEGLYSDELLEKIAANHGSCKGLVPSHISDVFVTSVDIHWIDHLFALAVAQKGISNSISKTVNLPRYVTPEDFKLAYLLARYLGIKGLALYRDGSRESQVLDTTSLAKVKENEYKNPFNGHLTSIGGKGSEKTAVIEAVPSYPALKHINENIIPQIKDEHFKKVWKDNLIMYNEKQTVNTDKKCPLCN
ncbi:MAG: adenosylcobalamin-dependent ribonucleoside-diphosphate reductase, partial [Candidatus Nitrosocosmicus sp.]